MVAGTCSNWISKSPLLKRPKFSLLVYFNLNMTKSGEKALRRTNPSTPSLNAHSALQWNHKIILANADFYGHICRPISDLYNIMLFFCAVLPRCLIQNFTLLCIQRIREAVTETLSSLECNRFATGRVIFDILGYAIAPNLREINVLTLENDRKRMRE